MLSTTITIIGSGTCVPSLKRSACSVLIEVNGQKVLVDCGPGTMRRLLEVGVSIFELTHLCFSHFHPDHTSELVPLLFATKYPDSGQRQKPLTLIAGQGIKVFYKGLQEVYGPWIELPPGLLRIKELATNKPVTLDLEHFTLHSIPVEHNPESIAFRIDSPNGQAVVYSGDTDFSDNLISLANGADLLICESRLSGCGQGARAPVSVFSGRDCTPRQCGPIGFNPLLSGVRSGRPDKRMPPNLCRPIGTGRRLAATEVIMRYYPVFLDIIDKSCLVVGGGQVGTRKVLTLLDCGARVTVVSLDVTPELQSLADQQKIALRLSRYRTADLDGMFLVIGATDDEFLNRKIHFDAERQHKLCNIADRPGSLQFYLARGDQSGGL